MRLQTLQHCYNIVTEFNWQNCNQIREVRPIRRVAAGPVMLERLIRIKKLLKNKDRPIT